MGNKYLKVMADYCSSGLWNFHGVNVSPDDYALSAETKKKLKDWCNLYESNDSYLCDEDRKKPLFDLFEFDRIGLEVAASIKKDLPSYTVVYFKEVDYDTIVFDVTQITKQEKQYE